mgnify:CR=1 FL=1
MPLARHGKINTGGLSLSITKQVLVMRSACEVPAQRERRNLMQTLRSGWSVLCLSALLLSCNRPSVGAGSYSLSLSAETLTLQPGQVGTIAVKLVGNTELATPVLLSVRGAAGKALTGGISGTIDPDVVVVKPATDTPATLRIITQAKTPAGDYQLAIIGRSDGEEEGAALKLTVSGESPGWTRQLGTPTTDVLAAMATDSVGNVYVGMYTTGALDGKPNAGIFDGYLLKYRPTGALEFATPIATTGSDVINAITVDAQDNVYVAGHTFGTFPGQMNQGTSDGFVAKYGSSGQQVWVRQFGTSSIEQIFGVSVDPSGGVYVTGVTEGSFPGYTNAGQTDIVLARFGSDGTPGWVYQLGTDQQENAWGVATDAAGAAYVVGGTKGTLPGLNSQGGFDAYLLKVNTDGKLAWSRQMGSNLDDQLQAVLTDPSGAIYTAGWARGPFPGQIQAGSQDALLLRYTSDGVRTLARQFGTSYNDALFAITRVGNSIYTAGSTRGGFANQVPLGKDDLFVVRHDLDGSPAWLRQLGTTDSDTATAVAVTPDFLYLGGKTFGTFEGQTLLGDSDGLITQIAIGTTQAVQN